MLIKFANDTSLERVPSWKQRLNVWDFFILVKLENDSNSTQGNSEKGSVIRCSQKEEIRCLKTKFKTLTRQQFNKKSVGVTLDNRTGTNLQCDTILNKANLVM